jgi:hypothetical protein
MSEEQRRDEETEVEGHSIPPKFHADDEPEVEGHSIPPKFHANEDEDEVEGHLKKYR